jgi:hypothetical protein
MGSPAGRGDSRGCTETPGFHPVAAQGGFPPLPTVIGHCWTDTGGEKQENACVREKAALPSLQAAWLAPLL